MRKANTEPGEMDVQLVAVGKLAFRVVGTSPLVYHAMSAKGVDELLFPSARKTTAEKQATLKHEPWEEYRASTYIFKDATHPTRLMFPCGAFKSAMEDVATDLTGVKKAQVKRLVWMVDRDIPIWGIPQIFLATVRNSDMNRTPDIRSRAILLHWAAQFELHYVRPNLSDRAVGTLLANGGVLMGIGDGRQQNGQGFGQFRVCADDDKEFAELVKHGGREAQDAALKDPACYDVETERALGVYLAKLKESGDRFKDRLPMKEHAAIDPSLGKPNGRGRHPAVTATVRAAAAASKVAEKRRKSRGQATA